MNKQPIQIDISKLQTVKCPKCEGTIFIPVLQLKKMNKFQSPNGQESLIPIQLFKCDHCGTIITPEMQQIGKLKNKK